MRTIVEDYERELRIEWPRELLDSGFALPDGTVVKWGDATVAEHTERLGMLTRNAEANIEAAARHQRAIEELRTAGADTLRNLAAEMVEGGGTP